MPRLRICLGLLLAVATAARGVAQSATSERDTLYADLAEQALKRKADAALASRHADLRSNMAHGSVGVRQKALRRLIRDELGTLPVLTPLHPVITGTVFHEDYVVEKLIFESQPHFYVTANIYRPAKVQGRSAAVLGLAGHSAEGKAYASYQSMWIALARQGFLVLAIDPIGQGERSGHLDKQSGQPIFHSAGTEEHVADGLAALLTGSSIAGTMVWDGMRAIDYLRSRPDVDSSRIAVAGNSGGGTQAAYLAATDKRIAAAVVSCYMTSWEAMWDTPGPQDAEQVFDRMLAHKLDYADLASAFAPRALLLEAATRDFFPIAGTHATFREARETYARWKASQAVTLFEEDDTHGWTQPRRLAATRWLSETLAGRPGPAGERPVELDSPKALDATATGQVLTSLPDAQSLQALTVARATELRAMPFAGSGLQLARRLRSRLRLPAAGSVRAKTLATETGTGGNWSRVDLETEPGVKVPAILIVPNDQARRRPAAIYISSSGAVRGALGNAQITALVRSGYAVLALDPRGWGKSAQLNTVKLGYGAEYQFAMRALLVGETVPGMQTRDVLSAYAYLATRQDIDATQISIRATGFGCHIGAFAAVLQPSITQVACDSKPVSYLDMVKMPLYTLPAGVIVPGILQDFDMPDVLRVLSDRYVEHPLGSGTAVRP